MLGLLSGSKEEIYDENDMVGGEMGTGKWMRQGDYKAVEVPKPYGNGAWELYDVKNDPGETKNLASKKPELLSKLKESWKKYSKEVGIVLAE